MLYSFPKTPCYGFGYLSAIDSLDTANNEDAAASSSSEATPTQSPGGAGPDVQTLTEGIMELTDLGLANKISTVFEDCSTQIDEEHLYQGEKRNESGTRSSIRLVKGDY